MGLLYSPLRCKCIAILLECIRRIEHIISLHVFVTIEQYRPTIIDIIRRQWKCYNACTHLLIDYIFVTQDMEWNTFF